MYFAFDLLELDGEDLKASPIRAQEKLAKLLGKAKGTLRYSEHIRGQGEKLLQFLL